MKQVSTKRHMGLRWFCVVLLLCSSPFTVRGIKAQEIGDASIGLIVDADRLRANRIRQISSRHLTLFTDLPEKAEIDELGKVFDQAVAQWKDYFGLEDVGGFRAIGFLMKEKARFERAGVIPEGLPNFKNGYTLGRKCFWMVEQPGDYMRRQLMLHEGTHAFLFSLLGPEIPPWYNEGLAEAFGCHEWNQGKLTTRAKIVDKEDAPYWGRPKLVREEVAKGNRPSLEELRNLSSKSFLRVDPYAWVWAMIMFLDRHPDYSGRFQQLPSAIKTASLDRAFDRLFADDGKKLEQDWQAFLSDLDYGVDGSNAMIVRNPSKEEANRLRVIVANKSWQNSGITVSAGTNYLIRSKGRFVIRESMIRGKPTAWPCEPNGVTLEYYRGQPLGQLMALVIPDSADARVDFDKAQPIGLSSQFKPATDGKLYFRVNESPSGLSDNSGQFRVSVVPSESK